MQNYPQLSTSIAMSVVSRMNKCCAYHIDAYSILSVTGSALGTPLLISIIENPG
jgi:hypothetical protein